MIPTINVKHDLNRLSAGLGLLTAERMKAAVRALNRTLTTVRAEGARDMGLAYRGLKISAIKRQMRFKRASQAHPAAVLTFSNRRFRLFGNWRTTQTRRGVRTGRLPFRLETGGGRRLDPEALRHAFLQRSRQGTANVWLRAGKERYPIEVIVAPSLAEAFVERAIGEALSRRARARFGAVFQQEAKFRLSKRR